MNRCHEPVSWSSIISQHQALNLWYQLLVINHYHQRWSIILRKQLSSSWTIIIHHHSPCITFNNHYEASPSLSTTTINRRWLFHGLRGTVASWRPNGRLRSRRSHPIAKMARTTTCTPQIPRRGAMAMWWGKLWAPVAMKWWSKVGPRGLTSSGLPLLLSIRISDEATNGKPMEGLIWYQSLVGSVLLIVLHPHCCAHFGGPSRSLSIAEVSRSLGQC